MTFTRHVPLASWRIMRIASLLLSAPLLAFPIGCGAEKVSRTPEHSDSTGDAAKPLFDLAAGSGQQGRSVSQPPAAATGLTGQGSTTRRGSGGDASEAYCPKFVDIAESVGLNFIHHTGARGKSLMVETLGGGCGVLDFDNDGVPDLVFSQGGDPTAGPDDADQPRPALFRGVDGQRLEDVSAAALPYTPFFYGQGIAVGDFDGDGFDDIYVTRVGGNLLLRNQGDGSFVDVTDQASVAGHLWSSSAAWADLTGNGLLDLYVCNYVDYDPKNPRPCLNEDGEPRICHPQSVDPVPDECYINLGDGTFAPEASLRGLTGSGSKALGVAVADFNLNGLPDIYVANDTTANFLFINQGEGRFREMAMLLGAAVDRAGAFQASMGLAIGDYDGDGLLDIYSTHFQGESNTLYHNQGDRGFQDVTGFLGLHELTLPRLGFGTVMQDFNQNGRQELFVTNGHIENYPGNSLHKQRPQLLSFDGHRFVDCSEQAGIFFKGHYVGRGVAMCDYNGDGAVELVVVHQDGPAALLRSQSPRGHWLKVEFRGRRSNRRGIGCRVEVRGDDKSWHQQLVAGSSYASSHQPALFFGLGTHDENLTVDVLWPSGQRQRLHDIAPNQSLVIVEP